MKKDWRSDGVTIKEWITYRLVNYYGIIALIIALKLLFGELTTQDNEFFWTLSWPVMVIVGFYFAEKIALNFGRVARLDASARREERGGSETYDAPLAQPPPDIPYREERIDANTRV